MWWLLPVCGGAAAKAGATAITWIGGTELLGAAIVCISGLLLRIGGQGSAWRIDTTNSNGRLIFIKETDGRINISTTTIKERKSINELLESWNGNVGIRPGTKTRNKKFRLDLQGHTQDEAFVNLQRNEGRSGSRGRQQGGGGNSSSTTVAQVFIPTELLDELTREDIIAGFMASMESKKAVVVTPNV
ncbi:uncharacterized protein LOC131890135 isoform X2 [Tigriopus californicus]|uniref:uncharacterized protein LOC131890135 isoform X2 n=1 Tax=Tigriopus californicus TaxID=6832 RepID=UPI0027D9E039|nr:uncharacterized protein LOC131890135 isoform X2 [Tigriopus californicus]